MALNIKNEQTYRLARELAESTGESLTSAVTTAISERLARLQGRSGAGRADRLLAIARSTAPLLRDLPPSTDIGVLLYDERGLPR